MADDFDSDTDRFYFAFAAFANHTRRIVLLASPLSFVMPVFQTVGAADLSDSAEDCQHFFVGQLCLTLCFLSVVIFVFCGVFVFQQEGGRAPVAVAAAASSAPASTEPKAKAKPKAKPKAKADPKATPSQLPGKPKQKVKPKQKQKQKQLQVLSTPRSQQTQPLTLLLGWPKLREESLQALHP